MVVDPSPPFPHLLIHILEAGRGRPSNSSTARWWLFRLVLLAAAMTKTVAQQPPPPPPPPPIHQQHRLVHVDRRALLGLAAAVEAAPALLHPENKQQQASMAIVASFQSQHQPSQPVVHQFMADRRADRFAAQLRWAEVGHQLIA